MNAFHLGGTIKITGMDRHPGADELILGLDRGDLRILDVGASDGSTSLDLIARLPGFRSYVISDRYLTVRAVRSGRHLVFFDPTPEAILVVGPRMLAWPSLSRAVALLYRAAITDARAALDRRGRVVSMLNPAVRRTVAADGRVTAATHDVFQPWTGHPIDVIKIANVLRRLYFSDAEILRALTAVIDSLPDGGHLLVVDNPRIPGIAYRAGLYRRAGDRFTRVGTTEHPPEVADLVEAARATPVG